MSYDLIPEGTTRLSRGERLLLIVTAFPALGGVSFAAVSFASDLIGFSLYGRGGWGLLGWVGGQAVASILAVLTLAVIEAVGAGTLWLYTVLGTAAGVLAFVFMDGSASARALWILPLQYGLIGTLLGWVVYRRANRPDKGNVPSSNDEGQ